MAALPEALQLLIAALGKLPGVGPRSAERIALHLVQAPTELSATLAEALTRARSTIQFCTNCGGLTERQPCAICADSRRDATILCVVEKAVDILAIEKAGSFRGQFHVLGGRLSPLNGIGPEDLRIAHLAQRIPQQGVKEIILALPSDVEGDATSHYLAKAFAPSGVRISRIAQGLPAGSGLDYADELTLSRALEGRRDFQ
ncbi:MAG TPA: recombination mediator RecR [Verrucomicrobiae bacterium]|nr:recombination mediator RecR [Verrucomicrobiae bacterium]